ncbi:hypothetical protein CJU89_1791 [Yarrowia sp. B02]|nr:hypothetical protein CJU89_1791 [Yarrowia sp. B02]
MPQAGLKKREKTSKVKKPSGKIAPKRAAPRKIAPRRKGAQRDVEIAKKHQAALTTNTEKLLASRVGHLEILKGNRRELEKKNKEEEEKKKKKAANAQQK